MLLKDLELAFKNKSNFKKIFNQQVKFKKEFQRLEFLGDRVIGLILAADLYDKFKDFDEGSLAKLYSFLTSAVTIEKIAKKIGLDIFLEKHKVNNISRKVLTDFIEAILGALYIEQGLEKTRYIIIALWEKEINNDNSIKSDPKSLLQEWSQAKNLGLPVYKFVKKSGPDHNPHFIVKINVQKHKSMTGEGKSIQEAQKIAAQIFIDKYIKDN